METGVGLACWGGLEELEPVLRASLGRRCRDASELDDVVQETLLRAARYRASLADPSRLRGWTVRIGLNVLRDRVRRERRLRRIELTDDLLEDARGTEDPPAGWADTARIAIGGYLIRRGEALGIVSEALAGMREEDRRLLGLHYGAGQSGDETAAQCRIPRQLLKVRLFRARRRLARDLGKRLLRVAREDAAAGRRASREAWA